jgi:hypothetical protein
MAYKGKYKVINGQKYKGDCTKVIYRSLWERRFMIYCDTNSSILRWSSEEIVIPYKAPIERKTRRYYPDFYIEVKRSDGKKDNIVVEVKPKKQTQAPKVQKTKTKRYLREVKTWGINSAKWKAAVKYCKQRNWRFLILTEDQLLSNYKPL